MPKSGRYYETDFVSTRIPRGNLVARLWDAGICWSHDSQGAHTAVVTRKPATCQQGHGYCASSARSSGVESR